MQARRRRTSQGFNSRLDLVKELVQFFEIFLDVLEAIGFVSEVMNVVGEFGHLADVLAETAASGQTPQVIFDVVVNAFGLAFDRAGEAIDRFEMVGLHR